MASIKQKTKKGVTKSTENKLHIQLLSDRVLIQTPAREEKTASGIIIPETVTEKSTDSKRGVVVAVGEGKYEDGVRIPMQIKEGDNVLFQWGEKVEIDGEEYDLVTESNILAIVK